MPPMLSTELDRFWYAIGWVFALNNKAFQIIVNLPNGVWLALLTVVLAGLSLAIGQSIILFINRVKPERFFFSLFLNALLYTVGFLLLAISTWLICLLPWSVHLPFRTVVTVLGLGYAPLLFSFLGALPYLGIPILAILAVWHLLAIVVGFATVANIGLGAAFGYVSFGWFVKQLLKGTVGQPIARFNRNLANRVADVDLVNSRAELEARVMNRIRPAEPIGMTSQLSLPEVQQLIQAAGRSSPEAAQAVTQAVQARLADKILATQLDSVTTLNSTQDSNPADPLVQLEHSTKGIPQPIKLALSLLLMTVIFVLLLVLLHPLRQWIFGWYMTLSSALRILFDLVWIAVVAIVFSGILAPLESLGWWAGWYGDELGTAVTPVNLSPLTTASTSNGKSISRYVVYLDGIGQSGDKYTPDVEDFLVALEPALPEDIKLVQGLMMYSVLNKPLDKDRPLAWLWKTADKVRWKNPNAILGMMVNWRNMLIVAVSSDKRYGPIYNQGIAQVIFDGLLKQGYQPGSGIPITLIGYSGGGEMASASAPYLKRATGAPIDVITLGGVMSANNNFLQLEHLYHVVGDKDPVEKAGPIMFPGRWKPLFLSYWNRAKRKGKISILSVGPIGHQVPGGYMDPKAVLPDGRTHLQHTIEVILQILSGQLLQANQSIPRKSSNYEVYQQAAFIHPAYYPIHQIVDPDLYQPLANWMGRLILPKREDRHQIQGVLFEVHHAPEPYQHFIGEVVNLCWSNDPTVQKQVEAATRDVHFSADAEYSSQYGGAILADRINHWRQVDPLESLAAGHPVDDITVMLDGQVEVEEWRSRGVEESRSGFIHASPPHPLTLRIHNTPIQATGQFYALVKFVQPITGTDQFQVNHFNRNTLQFDGAEEIIRLPEVLMAQDSSNYPSTTRDLEKSPLNELGWFIYGAKDAQGIFVVQALGPRSLFRLQPQQVLFGKKTTYTYIRKQAWANAVAQKGQILSVLGTSRPNGSSTSIQSAIRDWQEGDRALLIHNYGGIGGKHKEASAATPIYFGHFAYGVAIVIREPLSNELIFDIRYHQIYAQNTDGLVSGTLHWSRYMGDRQFGWLGLRPTCDILIKLDDFTKDYTLDGKSISPLSLMIRQLQVMTARYRIGDGTGSAFVGPANNCAQDSNQALFASIRTTLRYLQDHTEVRQRLLEDDTEQGKRFRQLQSLRQDLERELQSLGGPRSDWEKNEYNLGSTLEDKPFQNLWTGLGSWRTMLPRLASDTITKVFLDHGATVWILRTNQVGGNNPDLEPIAPVTL